MTMRNLPLVLVLLLALPVAAQNSTTSVNSSSISVSRFPHSSDFEFSGRVTVGGYAPQMGPSTTKGAYYGTIPKLTHKPSNISLDAIVYFEQSQKTVSSDRYDYFDNPTLRLYKSWTENELPARSWFSEIRLGLASTFAGNRETYAKSFTYSLSPYVNLIKEWRNGLFWRQTAGYGHGTYNQSVNPDGSRNSSNAAKYANELIYNFNDNFYFGALIGSCYHAAENRVRSTWGLTGEYKFSKNLLTDFGYGPAGFVSMDTQGDQLAINDNPSNMAWMELTLTF